jgi:hypothetical protein
MEKGYKYGSDTCSHKQGNYEQDDYFKARDLHEEFVSEPNLLPAEEFANIYAIEIVDRIYLKYQHFSEEEKAMYRLINVTMGTDLIIEADKSSGLINSNQLRATVALIYMTLTIEIQEKYRDNKIDVMVERCTFLTDIVSCTHAIVRFFHKRIGCDCLKDIYYNLKANTKKTTVCMYCKEEKAFKEVKLCKCKLVQYCSRECQRADWQHHKEFCKYVRHMQYENSVKSESTDD